MQDVIIYNESYERVLPALQITSIRIFEGGEMTEFAVEDGTIRSDHFVELQKTAEITAVLIGDDISESFGELRAAYESRDKFIIQSRESTLHDMVLTEYPRDNQSGELDSVLFSLQFKQWKDVKAREGTYTVTEVAVPQQSDTVRTGTKSGQATNKKIVQQQPAADTKDKSFTSGIMKGVLKYNHSAAVDIVPAKTQTINP